MLKEPTVIIKLNAEDAKSSTFEQIGHLLIKANTECDKFLVLYTFLKLNILNGKTLIYATTVHQAYKIRMFLLKFQIKSFVLNPDHTKLSRKSVVHFFNIGQYDILILVRGCELKDQKDPGEVLNVVNFDIPRYWKDYKYAADKVGFDNGSCLTFMYTDLAPDALKNPVVNQTDRLNNVPEMEDSECLQLIEKKMAKKIGTSLIQPLNLHWEEIKKLKSRVEDVVLSLNHKLISTHIQNEVKKQLLHSKRLKEYFEKNQEERAALEASLAKELEM